MAVTITLHPGVVFNASTPVTIALLNQLFSSGYATIDSGTLDTANITDGAITGSKINTVFDLTGKTVTLPANRLPVTSITAGSTVPDFIGQIGLTAALDVYVAYGTSAGNWKIVGNALTSEWHTGGTPKTLVAGTDVVLIEDSAASYAKKVVQVDAIANYTMSVNTLPAYYKHGLEVKNNAGTPTTQIDVDCTELMLSSVTSASRKLVPSVNVTINAATTGADALDTGSLVDATMYYIYVIYNGTSATTAGLISASATSPTMPSGYDYKRLVGESYYTTGGGFTVFCRNNDDVWFGAPQQVFANDTLTTSLASKSLPATIPAGCTKLVFEASSTAYNVSTLQIVAPANATAYAQTATSYSSASNMNAGPTSGYNSVNLIMRHAGATSVYARANYTSSQANQNLHAWGYTLPR